MRVVVVSNATMQPLAARLPGHEVVVGGVGDLPGWLLDPSSPAADPSTDVVLVHAEGAAVLPPLGHAEQREAILGAVERFAAGHPSTSVVVTTLVASSRTAAGAADASLASGRFRARATWDLRLSELAEQHPNVTVLDGALLLEGSGLDELTSDAYWYLGRIPLSAAGFDALGRELLAILDGLANRARKVLVLDLDGTLWGGVVGEDGLEGIALSEDGTGKCFRDFQRHLQQLARQGTLLAVVSKNDAAIVEEVLAQHPMMVLGRDDLVAVVADWSPKPDRLRALAATLELGLDSFVVLDDNPVERELIRATLPEVAVPDFPTRPEQLSRWLLHEVVPRWFPRVRVFEEDRLRTQSYQAREARRSAESTDLEGFLASLDVKLTFTYDLAGQVGRLSQLTQKTNQFNLTTDRRTPAEVGALVDSPDALVIGCDYEDRFAKEGTVGLAIVDLARGELVNLLLSCRVLSRGVEGALLAEVEAAVRRRGHRRLRATFVPTARNGVASTFLHDQGFVGRLDDGTWVGEKELG